MYFARKADNTYIISYEGAKVNVRKFKKRPYRLCERYGQCLFHKKFEYTALHQSACCDSVIYNLCAVKVNLVYKIV